jgi:hypothetical protein
MGELIQNLEDVRNNSLTSKDIAAALTSTKEEEEEVE